MGQPTFLAVSLLIYVFGFSRASAEESIGTNTNVSVCLANMSNFIKESFKTATANDIEAYKYLVREFARHVSCNHSLLINFTAQLVWLKDELNEYPKFSQLSPQHQEVFGNLSQIAEAFVIGKDDLVSALTIIYDILSYHERLLDKIIQFAETCGSNIISELSNILNGLYDAEFFNASKFIEEDSKTCTLGLMCNFYHHLAKN